MKNKKLTTLFWLLQGLVLLAFGLYDTSNVQLNLITEFNREGNLSLWKAAYRVSFFLWTSGWAVLIFGSVLGVSRDWYISKRSRNRYIALAFLFAPSIVLSAVVLFQPL
jgi:hypothetical protein